MKKIAWPELHFPCTHRCNPRGIRMGKGRPFGVHPDISCCALSFVMRGNIYIFADKSQAIKRFIKQKMSFRTQRSKTICMVLRWAGVVGWGWRMEMGLAVKHSPFSAYGKNFYGWAPQETRVGVRNQKGCVSSADIHMVCPPSILSAEANLNFLFSWNGKFQTIPIRKH